MEQAVNLTNLLRAAAEPDPEDTYAIRSLTSALEHWTHDPAERRRISDLADLVDAEGALEREEPATALRCGTEPTVGLYHRQHDGPALAEDQELDHSQTDTTPTADTTFSRRTGVYLIQSRETSRTVDNAVEISQSLTTADRDLRVISGSDHEEIGAVIAQLRLLRHVPAGALGVEGSASVLEAVGHASSAMVAGRYEGAALRLIEVVRPHLKFLGRRDPAAFTMRRARAEALCELGDYQQAEILLRELSVDEERAFSSSDPHTVLALYWALGRRGQVERAEAGLGALQARLAQTPDVDERLQWHVQCRRSWLLGQRGQIDEAKDSYLDVINNRSRELGFDHSDTSDAQHSYGKLLVCAGEGSGAVGLLESLAEDRVRIHGDEGFNTLETEKYLHLAQVQAQRGDDRVLRNAIDTLTRISRIQNARYNPLHPSSRDTSTWLGTLLRVQEAGRFREPLPDLARIPALGLGQHHTDQPPSADIASQPAPDAEELGPVRRLTHGETADRHRLDTRRERPQTIKYEGAPGARPGSALSRFADLDLNSGQVLVRSS
jgi:hypothetical protein